jgi:DNA-binding IclR family transcriptional regulator
MTTVEAGLKIIKWIFESPGIYTQDALARISGFSPSKVSRLCQNAEKAGFILKSNGVYVYGPVIQNIINQQLRRKT